MKGVTVDEGLTERIKETFETTIKTVAAGRKGAV
jgi:hypothetical protein